MSTQQKVVVVTGASQGIGAGIVSAFRARNCPVVATSRSIKPAADAKGVTISHSIADEGLWILGTSEHAHDNLDKIERDRPWLLVLGNEEKGMRRLTEESCDVLCKIAPQGKVTSLNVSVAAGIFISTLSR